MKTTWNIWSVATALAAVCGLLAYATGWAALISGTQIWNIATEFWFFDAVASVAFAIFFFLVYIHSVKR